MEQHSHLIESVVALVAIAFLSISLPQGIGVYSQSSSPSVEEVNALLEFKANYIHDASQDLLSSWNSSSASMVCASWVGITCITVGLYNRIDGINLTRFGLAGYLPPDHRLDNLNFLSTLDLSYNFFSGSIPENLGQLFRIQTLDLSNNNFVGSIPESLGQLLMIQTLDLSNNNFVGSIPESLGQLVSVRTFDLSSNNLTGLIPTNGVFMRLNANSFRRNPSLCGPILHKKCTHNMPKTHIISIWHLRILWGTVLVTFLSIILLLTVLLIVWCYCLPHHGKGTSEVQFIGKLAGAKRYSAQELMEATQGYSEDNLLGRGGFSVVYKGVLTDGKTVAVKKLKDVDNSSLKALLQEMKILGRLRHRNLVQVLGCVLNLDVKALVLEYMANGSLEDYMNMHQEHTNAIDAMDFRECLSHWEMMIRVATSLAKALAYLHHGYDVPIIHGDVKPSNILLDSDMEPHLADLGLAKVIDQGAEAVSLTLGLKGSIGYMAPEYALAARITTKVDVYAYGVVLLGMLTGKRPTQVIPDGVTIHEWVKSKLPAKDPSIANVEEVLDASLLLRTNPSANNSESSTYNHCFIVNLLQMGLACTMDHPNDRPTIHQVLGFLTSRLEYMSRDGPL